MKQLIIIISHLFLLLTGIVTLPIVAIVILDFLVTMSIQGFDFDDFMNKYPRTRLILFGLLGVAISLTVLGIGNFFSYCTQKISKAWNEME